jgi:hypothetical protein
MQHEQERTGLKDHEYTEGLSEALEQQQTASRAALHWQGVLAKTEDRNARRYYEGLIKLSTLQALHHNLIAKSHERARQDASTAINRDHGSKSQIGASKPTNQVNPSPEIILTEKGRNRARAEYDAHQVKTEAFALLGDSYRRFANESLAHTYYERARLESASARGFDTVINAYDKKLEDFGNPLPAKEVCLDIQIAFRSLQQADRHLEHYNHGYDRVWNYIRRVLANERTIQRLETTCSNRPESAVEHRLLIEAVDRGEKLKRLTETEAIGAAISYRNFQKQIESAEKVYDALSRVLTCNPAELTNASPQRETSGNREQSQTLPEAHRGPERPGRSVAETSVSTTSIEEPELDKPEPQASGSDLNNVKPSGHRQSRAIVAAVISQTLREMDREL